MSSDRTEELAAALAAMDELVGTLGHELRNSVAPLVLLAEQLDAMAKQVQPIDSQQLARRAAMLTRNLNKLVGTIGRVSEVASLRTGKLKLQPTNVDLGVIAAEVCAQLAREASAGGVELRLTAAHGVTGMWDGARVAQIAASLISNAIRYGGGGDVEISTSLAADGQAQLVVRDYGTGIAPDARAHLFDRFEQRATRKRDGFGIGLWVARRLARAMGGDIQLDASVDPGACFCVRLPRD